MTRLSTDNIASINERIATLEASYRASTGKTLLEIGHYASQTEYLPLSTRKKLKVACVPITAGEGIIGDFSETVARILTAFAEVEAYVTETVDVAGFDEAIRRDADLVFLADDDMCLCRNLRTGVTSDNGFATGRGFASLLLLSSAALEREVLILGSGKVGSSAYHFLAEHKVPLRWYDLKETSLYHMDPAHLCRDWAQQSWQTIVDATTSPLFIEEAQVASGATLACPGIPFGVHEAALHKAQQIFRDELETGVMVMFCEAMRNGTH